jgi:hypothetical protein
MTTQRSGRRLSYYIDGGTWMSMEGFGGMRIKDDTPFLSKKFQKNGKGIRLK